MILMLQLMSCVLRVFIVFTDSGQSACLSVQVRSGSGLSSALLSRIHKGQQSDEETRHSPLCSQVKTEATASRLRGSSTSSTVPLCPLIGCRSWTRCPAMLVKLNLHRLRRSGAAGAGWHSDALFVRWPTNSSLSWQVDLRNTKTTAEANTKHSGYWSTSCSQKQKYTKLNSELQPEEKNTCSFYSSLNLS